MDAADDLRYSDRHLQLQPSEPETRITGRFAVCRVRQRREERLRQQGKCVRLREAQRATE
jgi:hypothetical protein